MKLHQFTARWWEELLRTEGRLERWLTRLWQAESGGAARFQAIVDRFEPPNDALGIYIPIIDDELRHRDLVEVALSQRGLVPPQDPGNERYWDQIWPHIATFEEACAAGTFGEMLARNRFRVIRDHEATPHDIRALVAQILPDEERHASLLGKLAGPAAMQRLRPFHMEGKKALGMAPTPEED